MGLKWGWGRQASWALHGLVHGTVHGIGAWYGGLTRRTSCTNAMHQCHARPSLPVVPDPNLTPPTQAPVGLHETAAKIW